MSDCVASRFGTGLAIDRQLLYRILDVSIKRVSSEEPVFELILLLDPDDVSPDKQREDTLYQFRDMILASLAITTLAPIHLRSQGVYTFPLGDRKYHALSLGPMNKEPTPVPLTTIRPFFECQRLIPAHLTASELFWQAISTDDLLHRFINLAIAIEMLANSDSPAGRDVSLNQKTTFLITDSRIRRQFVSARNNVFHGSKKQRSEPFIDSLMDLNINLVVIVRNYLGQRLGLNPITKDELSLWFKVRRMIMSVCYTEPEPVDGEGQSST